jgi:hypothetical protein
VGFGRVEWDVFVRPLRPVKNKPQLVVKFRKSNDFCDIVCVGLTNTRFCKDLCFGALSTL